MNKVSFLRLEDTIARFVLSPVLKPCHHASTASLSLAAQRVLRRPPIQLPVTNPVASQIKATARAANALQTPSSRVTASSELFPSGLTHVKSLIKKLPKETFSLFPLFYAYLLYHYKAIHLQNINICIPASSQRKIVTLTLGKGNREHRFAIEVKSGHPWKLLKAEQINFQSPATNWTKQLGNPFSFLIWKRHEFQTVYNIMIKDPLAPRTPRIASFTLPHAKAERLRIIQSQPKENIPVAPIENLKEAAHKETYNTKRFLQICIDDSKKNLRVSIPSQSEGNSPDEYVHIVQAMASRKITG